MEVLPFDRDGLGQGKEQDLRRFFLFLGERGPNMKATWDSQHGIRATKTDFSVLPLRTSYTDDGWRPVLYNKLSHHIMTSLSSHTHVFQFSTLVNLQVPIHILTTEQLCPSRP